MESTPTSSTSSDHATSTELFPVLFLIGRPAAGKSEVIKYLHGLEPAERASRLHIGEFYELDDFPMIWSWFEEDDILARHGRQRLHTDSEGYFLDNFEWNVLIERLDLEYRKWALENGGPIESAPPRGKTSVIEFARGKEHGGFREAFGCFTPELLARGAVLYIKVSFSESLRKNRRRFNPDKPHSILEHSLPDEKLERMYRNSDWEELTAGDSAYLLVNGVRVPYVSMENEDDVTTPGGDPLGRRLEESLTTLWERYRTR